MPSIIDLLMASKSGDQFAGMFAPSLGPAQHLMPAGGMPPPSDALPSALSELSGMYGQATQGFGSAMSRPGQMPNTGGPHQPIATAPGASPDPTANVPQRPDAAGPPMPLNAGPAAPPSPDPGMGTQGGFKGFMNGPKGDALMGLLAGWAQGGTWQDSLGKGGMGAVQGLKKGRRNQTIDLLAKRNGLDPETTKMLQDDPDLARQYIASAFKADGTSDMQNWEFGQRNPGFMKFLERGGGAGSGAPGSTERIIDRLRAADPSLSFAEALGLTQRSPNDEGLRMRGEDLALRAASDDPAYLSDPEGTINKYRSFYSIGANADAGGAPRAAGSPSAASPNRPGAVPPGSAFSPSRNMWRAPDGALYDASGKRVQ